MNAFPELDAGRCDNVRVIELSASARNDAAHPELQLAVLRSTYAREMEAAFDHDGGDSSSLDNGLDTGSGLLTPAVVAQRIAALSFQDEILKNGYLEQPDPLSGEQVRCIHSVPVSGCIFYRFEGKEVFFVVAGGYSSGYARVMIWLPARNLVIGLAVGFARSRTPALLVQFLDTINVNIALYRRYVSNPRCGGVAVMLRTPPFPHHIWNELPGLQRMLDSGALNHAKTIYACSQPLGPIAELYPELADRIRPSEFRPAIVDSLRRHYILIRPGSIMIPESVIERITSAAQRGISLNAQQALARFAEQPMPVLGISIRTNNRRWRSEQEGIVRLLRALAHRGLRFHVILFGFSLQHGATEEQRNMEILREEHAQCQQIVNKCGGTPIVSLVGAPLADCFVLAKTLDFYIANHGTIQHKIGWFANCGGLVHANRYSIDRRQALFATTSARVGGIAPQYIPSDQIVDFPAEHSTAGGRSNLHDYDFDWQLLLKPTAKALRARQNAMQSTNTGTDVSSDMTTHTATLPRQ